MAKKKTSKKTTKKSTTIKQWPDTLGARLIATYLGIKFRMGPVDLMDNNPPMKALPFLNLNAAITRRGNPMMIAGLLIKHLADLRIPLEDDKEDEDALLALGTAMAKPDNPSSKIVEVIDEYYKFRDEA